MNTRWDLGQLIAALKLQPQKDFVKFDFGGTEPTHPHSYRGYYEDLAIGFEDDGPGIRVHEFVRRLADCVGTVFQGYKGGDYKIGLNSRVWVARYGMTSDTAIVGIADCDYQTVIRTEWQP